MAARGKERIGRPIGLIDQGSRLAIGTGNKKSIDVGSQDFRLPLRHRQDVRVRSVGECIKPRHVQQRVVKARYGDERRRELEIAEVPRPQIETPVAPADGDEAGFRRQREPAPPIDAGTFDREHQVGMKGIGNHGKLNGARCRRIARRHRAKAESGCDIEQNCREQSASQMQQPTQQPQGTT